jgi:hypothetical protein
MLQSPVGHAPAPKWGALPTASLLNAAWIALMGLALGFGFGIGWAIAERIFSRI